MIDAIADVTMNWFRMILDVGTLGDAAAVPKLIAMDVRQAVARFLLDKTKIGEAVIVEERFRYTLKRARELKCDVYCCYHDCDSKDCPVGFHDDDDEEQACD